MRSILTVLLMSIFFLPKVIGQEKNSGLEFNISLIHPDKGSLKEYKYSVDPTFEVLYFFSVSKRFRLAGGIFAQAGKHNWLELYGHTFYDDFGMPYRLRTFFNRRLEFFSLGIPVKFEIETNSIVFNGITLGFTAGNHLKLNKRDFYKSEFVDNITDIDSYNPVFWDINFGFRKIFYQNSRFTLSLEPVAGYRHESPKKVLAYYNYFYYGLGLSTRWVK